MVLRMIAAVVCALVLAMTLLSAAPAALEEEPTTDVADDVAVDETTHFVGDLTATIVPLLGWVVGVGAVIVLLSRGAGI